LGGVSIGVFPRDERVMALRELLRLPARVTLRFRQRPAKHPAPVDRCHPDRIHEEQW
jgi:hypothetical protein